MEIAFYSALERHFRENQGNCNFMTSLRLLALIKLAKRLEGSIQYLFTHTGVSQKENVAS
jgi:hypothetical protein